MSVMCIEGLLGSDASDNGLDGTRYLIKTFEGRQ